MGTGEFNTGDNPANKDIAIREGVVTFMWAELV